MPRSTKEYTNITKEYIKMPEVAGYSLVLQPLVNRCEFRVYFLEKPRGILFCFLASLVTGHFRCVEEPRKEPMIFFPIASLSPSHCFNLSNCAGIVRLLLRRLCTLTCSYTRVTLEKLWLATQVHHKVRLRYSTL